MFAMEPRKSAAYRGAVQISNSAAAQSNGMLLELGAQLGETTERLTALNEAYKEVFELLQDYKDAFGDPEEDAKLKEVLAEYREERQTATAKSIS